MSDAWPDINVTKLDAARRQLDAAIRLLFSGEDAIAIHTLAHAAFGILKDVARYRGATRVLDHADDLASRLPGKSFWVEFNRPGNFFKHGDKDPQGLLKGIPEEINEALLFQASEIYRDLGCELTPEIETLVLWYRSIHFADIDHVQEPFAAWLTQNADYLHAESRSKLLEIGRELLTRLRAHRGKESMVATAKADLP